GVDMKATFPSVSIFRRVIAVTLTLFLTITFTSAAFANGDGVVVSLKDEHDGASYDYFEHEDCDEVALEPGEVLWHLVLSPSGGASSATLMPGAVAGSLSSSGEGHGAFHWNIINESTTAIDSYATVIGGEWPGESVAELRVSHTCYGGSVEEPEPEIDISPIFECWEEDAGTETYIAYFGWENRSTLDGEPYAVSREEASFNVTPWAYEEYFPEEFGYPNVVEGRPGRTDFYPNPAITIPEWDGENIVFALGGRTATAGLTGPECPAPPSEPEVPSIDLIKTPEVSSVTFDPDDGDDETVEYEYEIINDGETELTGITLVDDVLGTIPLTVTQLDIGESMKVTATHIVTAADAEEGFIENEATVTGIAPDETAVSAIDDATVEVVEVEPVVIEKPEIQLEKAALITPAEDKKSVEWKASAPNDTKITYEYVITNTGETVLTDITLVDDVIGTIELDATELDVGESMEVTATYTVTEDDAEQGMIVNEAIVTGTAPDETEVQDEAEETVYVVEVKGAVLDAEDELPVTGAPLAVLALLGTASIAGGAGLLRVSRKEE
ncbi:MAG: hypothetical protein R3324_06885, partial [Halobacteriales archaeon]|nr:hypothetical protein [Halobacteriales archaeon]